MSLVKNEPVAVVGSLVTAYHTVVAALLVFNAVHWSAAQVTQAEAAVVALLAIPVTLFVRNSVTPVATAAADVRTAEIAAGQANPVQVTYTPGSVSPTFVNTTDTLLPPPTP